jgi:formylmethanofuran dehydrogenase subunit C
MAVKLSLKTELDVPVEVDGIVPSVVGGKTLEEIQSLEVYHGNRVVKLGEIFNVSLEEGEENLLICEGDFSKVKWLGKGMDGGKILVRGNVGPHCGAFMKGGEITVEGHADDYLGAEMVEGVITVTGNAGSYTGAAYHGSMNGMKGGKILLEGNAGSYLGEKMKEGYIEVRGNAGDFVGYKMSGGKIVILGDSGITGAAMKGGEITVKGKCELPPSLKEEDGKYVGDILEGGKGVVITG